MNRIRNNSYRQPSTFRRSYSPFSRYTQQRMRYSQARAAMARQAAIARSNITRNRMLETGRNMEQIKKTSEGFENSNRNGTMILWVIILLIILWICLICNTPVTII